MVPHTTSNSPWFDRKTPRKPSDSPETGKEGRKEGRMAIVALRSVVGKLGNKSVYNNINRRRVMLGAFRSLDITNNGSQEVQPALQGHRSPAFFSPRAFPNGGLANKAEERKDTIPYYGVGRRYEAAAGMLQPIPVDDPNVVTLAQFAVTSFNQQKNAQLQFLRVVMASDQGALPCCLYYLTLEAVDAGAVKVYRAQVSVNLLDDSRETTVFGLVSDNGGLLKLIDNRDRCESRLTNNRDYVRRYIWDKLIKGDHERIPVDVEGPPLEEVTLSNLHKICWRKF
ncbi:hypothetical protein DVH24_027764 [Malus domestica]|uniref:Cysteine proteinase inhibitor n=1 Tax=Malus domestica TaxID=3750 RepID=A0A498HE78_MALDO|nr:hypothetical protein DVH24_027764 [Malus domestica]